MWWYLTDPLLDLLEPLLDLLLLEPQEPFPDLPLLLPDLLLLLLEPQEPFPDLPLEPFPDLLLELLPDLLEDDPCQNGAGGAFSGCPPQWLSDGPSTQTYLKLPPLELLPLLLDELLPLLLDDDESW